jgi:glycosyltransferase involved in cell wall biosynthesis
VSILLVPLLSLRPASASGTTFVRQIVPPLVRAWGSRDVVLLCDPGVARLLHGVGARFEVRDVPDGRASRLLALRRELPRLEAEIGPACVYVPDGQVVGAPVAAPVALALHHHLNWSRPQGMGFVQRAYWLAWYDRAMRRSLRRAQALLAPTRAFASEIAAIVPGIEGKLHVVPHGVSPAFRPATAGGTRAAPPRVLAVSNTMAYKNLAGTVRIFAAAAAGLPHVLRVAGVGPRDVERHARAGGVAHRVEGLGRLDEGAVVREMQSASALLMPTLVESFGLPALEAMACGLPVACSDLPSLREVTGGAAVLADPADEAGFARALCGILTDTDEADRLARRGLRRARAFSWDDAARRTADVLRRIAAST